MPKYKATDYVPVPPGLYTAKLEVIEEAESQHGVYYPWVFIIEDEGEFEDSSVVTAIISITRNRDLPSIRVTQRNGTTRASAQALRTTRGGGITEKVVIAVITVMDRKKREKRHHEANPSLIRMVDGGAS